MELKAQTYTSLDIAIPNSFERYSIGTPTRKRRACMLTKKSAGSRLMLSQTKIMIMIRILEAMVSSCLHLFARGCIPRVALEAREALELDGQEGQK